jgi:hypothetical protein
MTGRPSEFTQEMADAICELIADGQSLRAICTREEMPCKATVFKWLSQQPLFADQYARAREAQADTIFDEILDIADDASNDFMQRTGQDGEVAWQVNGEHIQRSRLRIDSRRWMAGKLRPKVYGDKQDITLKVNPLEEATDDDLKRRLRDLEDIIRPVIGAEGSGGDSGGTEAPAED